MGCTIPPYSLELNQTDHTFEMLKLKIFKKN